MSLPNRDEIADGYLAQRIELLPEGPAYDDFRIPGGTGWKILRAKSWTDADIHMHWMGLSEEMPPWKARLTLAKREEEAGLPDKCTAGRATTLVERQAAVLSRWRRIGFRHRVDDFESLASALGYSVTVIAGKPFQCGVSQCGRDALNPKEAAYTMLFIVHGPRNIRFQCGVSQCGGDPLLKIQIAEDLECIVRSRMLHTHVTAIFRYEEP